MWITMSNNYLLSYAVMDSDAGANPIGHHSYLLLSRLNSDGRCEVLYAVGYYSTPQSARNALIRETKKAIGLTYNLRDSYGQLKVERPREFVGPGSKAMHFALNQQQAISFVTNCEERIADEQQRIASYGNMLPQDILKEEQKRSDQKLKPFRWEVPFYAYGLFSPNYYTCKNDSLDTLVKLGIKGDALKPLNYGIQGAESMPINSGDKLEPLRPYYCGEMTSFKTSKGSVLTFDWDNPSNTPQEIVNGNSNIFLMQPLQTIYALDGKPSFNCQQKGLGRLDKALYQLQLIEIKLRKEYLFPMPQTEREKYFDALHEIYEKAQNIRPDTSEQKIDAISFSAEATAIGMLASLNHTNYYQIFFSDKLMSLAKVDAVVTLGSGTLKLLALAGISVASPALSFILIGLTSTASLCAIAKLIEHMPLEQSSTFHEPADTENCNTVVQAMA